MAGSGRSCANGCVGQMRAFVLQCASNSSRLVRSVAQARVVKSRRASEDVSRAEICVRVSGAAGVFARTRCRLRADLQPFGQGYGHRDACSSECEVSAQSAANGKVYIAKTNADGDYTIPDLAAGDYRVWAKAGDLRARAVKVTLAAGEMTNLVVSPALHSAPRK